MKKLLETKTNQLSEGLQWHIENNVSLSENVFRAGSEKFFHLFNEARKLWKEGKLIVNGDDDIWFLNSNLGEVGKYNGKNVLLDLPVPLKEAEYQGKEVNLNKPMRSSGPKKYKVYVKNDKGNVIVVHFGDAKGGLSAKISDKDARKAFADRHNCSDKKDRTKAGYWSCNLPRYGKSLGITSGNFYW
jgi:hypothetical protein